MKASAEKMETKEFGELILGRKPNTYTCISIEHKALRFATMTKAVSTKEGECHLSVLPPCNDPAILTDKFRLR